MIIMEVNEEDIRLRIWCMRHPSVDVNLFDQYKMLKEADEQDRELLKFHFEHERLYIFKGPDEALSWLKYGIIPDRFSGSSGKTH